MRPCDGEAVSGDAIVVKESTEGVFMSLIDALGHGREAAEVALSAIRYLKAHAGPDVVQVLAGLNDYLSGTRGAMAVLAFGDTATGQITCTGLGNPTIRKVGGGDEAYPSPDGLLGVRFRSPRVRHLQLASDQLLIMHSDGIAETSSRALTAEALNQPVGAIARRIVLGHGRMYDDAACLIARYAS